MVTPQEYREQLAAIQATFAAKSLAEQTRDLIHIVLELRPYERNIATETSLTWLQSEANKAICASIYAALAEQPNDRQGNNHYVKGWLDHHAIGTDENRRRARLLWEIAAGQGHSEAQYELGMSYKSYDGGTSDLIKAVRWLTAAAEQGHPQAQDKLQGATTCLQSDQRRMLRIITDAITNDEYDLHPSTKAVLSGFFQLQYIDPISMYSDNRRSKFIKTLRLAIAPYQEEDGKIDPDHHPAIFNRLKESQAFSLFRDMGAQGAASEWARRLQRDTPIINPLNEIILGYLGAPREEATALLAPAAFTFNYWSSRPKKIVSASEGNHYSFRIKFSSKDARDDFFRKEDNKNLFDHLRREEPNLTIDSTIGNRLANGYSIKITYPKNASAGFNLTLAELKLSLLPPAPNHAARLEARSPSSSSLNR